jgi:hypothetical protein
VHKQPGESGHKQRQVARFRDRPDFSEKTVLLVVDAGVEI